MRALNKAGQPHQLRYYRCVPDRDAIARDILRGLRQNRKTIDQKYFYDETGSQLFERITRLPEYYLARAEREILRQYRPVIAAHVGAGNVLLEPGCGNCEKIGLLLDAIRPSAYVCWDISADHLYRASCELVEHFPWLQCHALATDYSASFALPPQMPRGRRVVFFPGSCIGNFEPDAAVAFLQRLWQLAGSGGGLLIGVDLRKDVGLLQRAYNDRQSVTAAFNKNCLRHINLLTGSRFSSEAFSHVARYNRLENRIEMGLRCRYAHTVEIAGEQVHFAAGEYIHTEFSYKYTTQEFIALAARAGFRREKTWYDRQRLFSVHYLIADPDPVIPDFDPAEQDLFAPRPRMPDEGPYDLPDRRHRKH